MLLGEIAKLQKQFVSDDSTLFYLKIGIHIGENSGENMDANASLKRCNS